MFEDVDQYAATIGVDGAIILPPTLLEKMRWAAGTVLVVEETDDGILLTVGNGPA